MRDGGQNYNFGTRAATRLVWFFLWVAAWLVPPLVRAETWQAVDIGACAHPQLRTAVENAGELRIASSGADIGGTSDSMRFLYQSVSGDGELRAQIATQAEGTAQAKTLCMFRSGSGERAANIAWGMNASGKLILQMRRSEGAATLAVLSMSAPPDIRWVRLSRKGNTFHAATSRDGVSWIFATKQELTLPASTLAGIGVSMGARGLLGSTLIRNLQILFPAPAVAVPLTAPVISARTLRGTSVEITWEGACAPEGVAGYEVIREGQRVASLSAFHTSWVDLNPAPGAGFSYAVAVRDSLGTTATGTPVRIAIADVASRVEFSGALAVLGGSLTPGTLSVFAGAGGCQIQGAGIDLGGRSDSAQFVQQTLSGDGQLLVRVAAIRAEDAGARAGVLLRDGLGADAPYAALLLNAQGGVVFQYRSAQGGVAAVKQMLPARQGPQWLKLVRSGNIFSAFVAGDGEEWIGLGSQSLAMRSLLNAGVSLSSRSLLRQSTVDVSHAWIFQTPAGDLAPPSPPEVSILETTSTSVRMSIRGSRDDVGIAGFKVFRDGVEIAAVPPWISSFTDSGRPPGISALYTASALDGSGKVSGPGTPAEAATAPGVASAPWVSTQIGRPEAGSTLTVLGDVVGLHAAGVGVRESAEEFQFLHQSWAADGEVFARVTASSPAAIAGLMVRADLGPGAPCALMQLSSGLAPFLSRSSAQGKITVSPDETTPTPVWVKLRRSGGLVSAYKSVDGFNWVLVGVSPFPAGKPAFAGLMAASGFPDRRAHATFDQIQFSAGISNPEPQLPAVRFEPVAMLAGAAGAGVRGRWFREMERIYCGDLQGSVEFLWEAPAADVYRLQITGANRSGIAEAAGFGLDVFVDDAFVARLDLLTSRSKSSTVECLSPWLTAGAHRIRIQCANPTPGAHLQIDHVRVERPQGPDMDANGLSDWADSVLAPLHTVDRCPQTSRTSPACIEGAAQNAAHMLLEPQAAAAPGLQGRWYANVPLREDSSETPVRVQFDFGRAQVETTVRWIPTNILEAGTLSIRKGDALLLTVRPHAGAQGPMSIQISDTNRLLQGSVQNPVPCTFDKAGVFSVQGAFGSTGEVRGTLTVRVVEAALPRGIVGWVNQARTVDSRTLGAEVSVDGGPDVQWSFLQNASPGVRRFRVRSCAARPAPVLARLGATGPVLDRVTVDSFDLANNVTRVAEDYPDGSVSVSHAVSVRGTVAPDMEVRFEVFAAGVLFEDGRRVGVLKTADFDSSGMGSIRMLVPKGVRTSVCHFTRVYQAGVLIGQL